MNKPPANLNNNAYLHYIRLEVFTAGKMSLLVLWVATPCQLVGLGTNISDERTFCGRKT
jgi:hypothetical protein